MIGSVIERIQASPFGPAGRATASVLQTPWWWLRGRPVPVPPPPQAQHSRRACTRRSRHDLRGDGTFRGDRAELLPEVVRTLHGSAVFWVDGHYSGGPTALGDDTTPTLAELEAILMSEQPHVALVDDVR